MIAFKFYHLVTSIEIKWLMESRDENNSDEFKSFVDLSASVRESVIYGVSA